uniref:hypothetical protein n=1 Tax=Collinsella aerofaciens TaxID=74426 RepID=UPI00359C6587
MAGTIPADMTQYYVHAFRIMQKLAYLYGWQTFFEECDDVDDETLYEMAVLLGVMMGVGSANSMLTVIAKNAQETVAKKVARQSLTKTSWYPILKKLLSFMGIKITKQTVGDAAGKVVVGVGGVISGVITYTGLSKGSARLRRQLKCLPQASERIPGTGYHEMDEATVAKRRIDVAEPLFIEKFGFTPMFYGSIVEYADRLEESLATGEAKLDAYNPDVLL